MQSLHIGTSLTLERLENLLQGYNLTSKTALGWTSEGLKGGAFLDLSEVEFAEYSALVQLAILIEGGVRHGASVTIALPLLDPRKEELSLAAKTVEKRITARERAFQFMKHSGFIECVAVKHVPGATDQVTVLDNYDNTNVKGAHISDHALPVTDSGVERDKPYFLRRIFPMRWFDSLSENNPRNWDRFATHILSYYADDLSGLRTTDAKLIMNTILNELVENVHRHAPEKDAERKPLCNPHALVGGVVFHPETYLRKAFRVSHLRPCLQETWQFLAKSRTPLIRLSVGDSGRGIPQVLSCSFEDDHFDYDIPADTDETLTDVQRVLFWSLCRWSTSEPEKALSKRGTRGLWLVRRLVRSCRGWIAVRSSDSVIAWSYDLGGNEIPAWAGSPQMKYIPGTFLDATFLGHAAKPSPQIRRRESRRYPASHSLNLETMTRSTSGKLSASQEQQLLHKLVGKKSAEEKRAVVVVLEEQQLPVRSTMQTVTTLANAVATVAEFTNPGLVIPLMPNALPIRINVVADYINEAREQMRPHLKKLGIPLELDPILLLDAEGTPYWIGGSNTVRQVLERLTSADGGPLPYEALGLDAGTLEEIRTVCRAQPDIFLDTGEGFQLVFGLQEIQTMIVDNVKKQLEATAKRPRKSVVLQGPFRTPALKYVSHWINTRGLLDEPDNVGVSTAAYTLARKIEADERVKVRPSDEVMRVDIDTKPIAEALAVCLGLKAPRFAVFGSLEAYGEPRVAKVPTGTRVILCVDIVFSGSTITRTLQELLQVGAKPTALVCILDARVEKTPTFQDIPLISLAEADLSIKGPSEEVANIDPVLRIPELHTIDENDRRQLKLTDKQMIKYCADTDGLLCFGHMQSELGRHFTIFPNATTLIEDDELTNWVLEEASKWLDDKHLTSDDAIQIWHPGTVSDDARVITAALLPLLGDKYHGNIKIECVPIHRAACMGRWVFPRDLPPFECKTHVIMVDWGCLTTSTVMDLIRLASSAGAASFKALILLAEVALEKQLALLRLTQFNSYMPILRSDENREIRLGPALFRGNSKRKWDAVRFDVSFFSSLRIDFYTPHTCPLCKLQATFTEQVSQCPTSFLKKHAQRMEFALRERDRTDFVKRPQHDLFAEVFEDEHHLTSNEISQVLLIRNSLNRAISSTEERYTIQTKLEQVLAKGTTPEKMAWIRLIAAELTWLKLPPLCLKSLRESLADIALGIALGGAQLPLSPCEKLQALIVLLATDRAKYASSFADLFISCAEDSELIAELLCSAHVMLIQPLDRTQDVCDSLAASLDKCGEKVDAQPELLGKVEYCVQTLRILKRKARLISALKSAGKRDPSCAWRDLKSAYSDLEDHHEGLARSALPLITMLGKGRAEEDPEDLGPICCPPREWWQQALREWKPLHGYIYEHIIPYILELRDMFMNDHFFEMMSKGHAHRFQRFLGGATPYPGEHLITILEQFVQDPLRFQDRAIRAEAIDEWDWWRTTFVPRQHHDYTGNTCKVTQFLSPCPCDLETCLIKVEEHMHKDLKVHPPHRDFEMCREYDEGNVSVKIFCDANLLVNTICQAIRNACEDKHRIEPSDTTSVKIVLRISQEEEDDSGNIHLKILNDGTKRSKQTGHGMQIYDGRLKAFRGSFTGCFIAEGNLTYEASVTLKRW